ncbi:acetyl-CoA carboxylase biotin carboxylase subunit [Mangrovibacillus cuniculi]|uniref:ATP-grasp domain-containing protein n=1 Tax=Mangrovibacillus cuniculi TaxID=2593652 RepID=A0A7S8CAJ3_9BACI|nr:biotin carboxylase N-terminal domain-containing protein [Mangrovibacillus cuniculi]QPC46243.1 ATP-grasp domain-containing protein [Mangrovibacillus cuniculi]
MKWLIVNRGECASRIIRTAKKWGIETVCVYSAIDQPLPYVKEADHAVLLPGNRADESYMNKDVIISIAKECHVDMIHPGYGFLSEDPSFAQMVRDNGMEFIGPSKSALELLGNKRKAKEQAEQLGIPIIPGVLTQIESDEDIERLATSIGFPLMIKAVMGGGGMGIVQCSNLNELKAKWLQVEKLSQRLFHSSELILEKYIESARHIEVQVIGDKNGNVMTVGERECSIQRRRQKLVEEAPVKSISESCLRKLREASISLATSIEFYGIGTVEFLVTKDEEYFFMEMNPRLQVEHGVTELVTGIDLVETQWRIANGESITGHQSDIPHKGHAIQVRVYAEDSKTGYPSPGKVSYCSYGEIKNRRLERTYETGTTIPPFYDPLIAKLIVFTNTRLEAITELEKWLTELDIQGVKTNIDVLQTILCHKDVRENSIYTAWLQTI